MFKLRKSARIGAIRAACARLGMDDDTRRAMQRAQVGKDSLSAMTLPELDTVLDHVNGLTGYRGTRGKPHNFDRKPYQAKIEALLADMALPWSYAEAIAWRITGGKKPEAIQRLAWVSDADHFRGIIAALSREHKKRLEPARAALAAALEARGIDDGAQWCVRRMQVNRTLHTAAFPWTDTLQTLARLTKLAKDSR